MKRRNEIVMAMTIFLWTFILQVVGKGDIKHHAVCVLRLGVDCFEEMNLRGMYSGLRGLVIKIILLLLLGKLVARSKINQLKTSQNGMCADRQGGSCTESSVLCLHRGPL